MCCKLPKDLCVLCLSTWRLQHNCIIFAKKLPVLGPRRWGWPTSRRRTKHVLICRYIAGGGAPPLLRPQDAALYAGLLAEEYCEDRPLDDEASVLQLLQGCSAMLAADVRAAPALLAAWAAAEAAEASSSRAEGAALTNSATTIAALGAHVNADHEASASSHSTCQLMMGSLPVQVAGSLTGSCYQSSMAVRDRISRLRRLWAQKKWAGSRYGVAQSHWPCR